MNAMSSRNPPPTLLPELWLGIFELATNFQDEFDPDVPDAFIHPTMELPHVDNMAEIAALRATLTTRHALAFVCRAWHTLATPTLYRSLWLGSPRAFTVLAYTLKRKPELGAYTRRLDTAPYRTNKGSWRGRKAGWLAGWLAGMLVQILAYIPRLEVFVVSACTQISSKSPGFRSPRVLAALREACGPSLRRLSWVGVTVYGMGYTHRENFRGEVLALLNHAPNLHTLIGLLIPNDPSVTLPNLSFSHFLLPSLSATDHRHPLTRFPNLLHAHLVPERDDWELQPGAMGDMLLPPSLTATYISDPYAFRGVTGSTRITRLFLSAWDWSDYAIDYLPHCLPSVLTHLGIGTEASPPDEAHYTEFVEWLHACKKAAPELYVIRLSNDEGSQCLARHPEWIWDGFVQLAEQGVRLENAEGASLQPPTL
ncbi:hypothetical protein BC834DRAFT_870257 [Gloeopeniophorella convolvens]|nr:hypothetical protein BC834DRAFT_870257 [Gloeopeniophorella convolvens]